ncbi:g1346 [Coccomyxa viridis]|uniref:G1346 protein n=1 Tax=Coccomyxa viridis TaxID=1274662 RepID=A0ABP1FHT2_9CHLO
MYKKLQKKFISTNIKTKCNIMIEIQRLEDLPQVVKQLKVVWEKDGKVKAESDVCTAHKGVADINQVLQQDVNLKRQSSDQESFKPRVIVLKVKASKELGAWADMITICKKELDITAFAEAQCVKEDLSMSLPFTAKSGYGAAVAGCPKLIASITARILGSKDHPATPASAKERGLSQSSSPALEAPDDIALGLSSDQDMPSTAEGPAVETTVLIAQTSALERQPDHVAGSRKISIDPLQRLGKAASHDLPGDISLSSEAEEMIAAWNGGKSRYDDGEKPAASHAQDELSLQGQHTGEMAAGGRRQDVDREQDAEADTHEDSILRLSHKAPEEPTWAELMDDAAVSSLPPDGGSHQDLEHHPKERAWKKKSHIGPAKAPTTKPDMLPWWSEEQPPDEQSNAYMAPEGVEPDEEGEGAAYSQEGGSGRDAAWDSYSAEVSEHSAERYPTNNPVKPSSNLLELQHLRQHAQELARSEDQLRQEVASLTQQLEQASDQAAVHAQLQERCAELQLQTAELEESAQAQEARYSALEREHAQAAQAAQQGLEEDNARLEEQVRSGSSQLIGVQDKLQTAQHAADHAEARYVDLSGKVEALQEELAGQNDISTGNGADKDLKAELDYVREEREAAQAKGKELQIKKNAAEARLRTLQEEADKALDLAEKATAALEQERAQLSSENEQLQQQLAAVQDKQTSAHVEGTSTHATEDAREVADTISPTSGLRPGEMLQQVLKERDDLRQLLNEQLGATSAHTARINGLEQDLMDMQNATKLASQAATEQAARALALYAKEAQELRDQLVQAQARNSRGSGTFATIMKSTRGSFLRRGSSVAAPEEGDLDSKRADLAKLKSQIMLEQYTAHEQDWQQPAHGEGEKLSRDSWEDQSYDALYNSAVNKQQLGTPREEPRSNAELAKDITALKLHNAKLQATLETTGSLAGHNVGQELKEKLASWRNDGWLEQCCTNLAEQLRIAKAENAELQQEVEALRGSDSSGQSSPMAWDAGVRAAAQAHFDAGAEMETSSQGSAGNSSSHSRPKSGSWTSQRALEAQVATLRQQLDIAAATQMELQKEIDLLRMEGGADAVAQAVAVAVAARDAELAGLQRHAAELEGHLESVMHEAQEVQQESLDMRDHVVQLEAALRESEAKKEAMQQEKRMLEQQLLETAGDMAHAERRLTGSHVCSLASNRSSSMEYSSDEEGGHHISHLADMSAREVEALRAENGAIMKELVEKKLELAELHEEMLKSNHRQAASRSN